jgi:hypothetical protein
MSHPNRILPLAIVAATALQLSLVSIADAHPYRNDPGMQSRTRTKSENIGSHQYIGRQSAMRAAYPITQGGTTGGTVNPGLTGDHMMHGYNG